MIGYRTITVETDTHWGETSVPIFTHEEFLTGAWRIQFNDLLGKPIKPVVRVKAISK